MPTKESGYVPYKVNPNKAALQEDFLEFVEGLRKGSIGIMPSLEDQLDHRGRISSIDSPFGDYDLLVTEDAMTDILERGDGSTPDRFGFEFSGMMGIGKGDSRRVVSFGTADLDWFSHQDTTAQIPLAVKQFEWPKHGRTMLHEAAMYGYCSRTGVDTLRVFGLAKFASKAAILTYFRPELTTLDNIDWPNETLENEELHLAAAIESLAALHEKLIFHGDAEFKNLPFGQRQQEAMAVDFELTVSERSFDSPDYLRRVAQLMANDFGRVKKSMIENNLLPEDEFAQLEEFNRKFLLKYYARISRGNSVNAGTLIAAYLGVVESLAVELEGIPSGEVFQRLGKAAVV